ncbi:phage antirepressor KilAC domain-containing protein [Commensalibacter sp. M0402]|uniref:phage antirepressor KilAC domain-containing protein n=1 Tax=Commensalibacter TaxID=1079922 RepID=UPI001E4F3322|nr:MULTISPECIES: phage antirepressor KilAC domain-containing protein [Commensalibacter]MBI0083591.1 phage antirepressor KilAC domain-containing protein [Commensalibacter sp. W6292M3]MBI0088814.1 phage antirepressor KilAC domain-containing protein [Commensalibacter melissae]
MDQNLNTNSHEPFHSFSHQELIIVNTKIRQDKEGRYCLNDCHKASGGERKNGPSYWLENKQTVELVKEITDTGISVSPTNVIKGGIEQGTYVVKELVYAYAMWISPAFHLKVIRAYDDLVQGKYQPVVNLDDPVFLRNTLLTYTEKCMMLENENNALKPKADGFDRIATADGSLCITDAAKNLQMGPKELFFYLNSHEWIYRRTGNKNWLAYQDKIKQGLLEHKVTEVSLSDGTSRISEQVRITPKGLTRLSEMFSNHV